MTHALKTKLAILFNSALLAGTFACGQAHALTSPELPEENYLHLNRQDAVPDTNFAINYMKSLGIDRFIFLDKKTASIKLLDRGVIVHEVPALIGKLKGDHIKDGVTQAGIFALQISGNQSHDETAIIYSFAEKHDFNAIHPLMDIQGQNRPNRIKNENPDTRRITDGCINLAREDYNQVAQFAIESLRFSQGGDISQYAYMVVAPEKKAMSDFNWPMVRPKPVAILPSIKLPDPILILK
ncbi:MAG: hypothetical protein RBR86_06360 [Pseudobdellovibrionaceae bacterium]|jgi:hypothetical protein|nr:hypothetical protein [Pseudobdellovibrionaceae bacterium]